MTQDFTVEIRRDTRKYHRKNYSHVDVQRHLVGIKRQRMRVLVSLFEIRFGAGQWSFLCPGSEKKWFSFGVFFLSTRNSGQKGSKDVVVGIRRKRTSNFPCDDSIVQRSTQKQRTWKTVSTFHCRLSNNWNYFSQNCFCKPAQSSRSSRGDV